jgi:pyruvate dehydrogenase E1 component alpha subunit
LREQDPDIDRTVAEWRVRFDDEIRSAVAYAKEQPFPDIEALLDGVYQPVPR